MLKNFAQLEHKIGERVYHLNCDPTAPTHEVKEALCQFMKYIGYIEDQAKSREQEEVSKVVVEPEKVEDGIHTES